MRSACLAPEILKPRRRQLRVPDRMLNVAVTEVSLDRSGIISLVGQGITAGMPIPSVLRVHAESDIRHTGSVALQITLVQHDMNTFVAIHHLRDAEICRKTGY